MVCSPQFPLCQAQPGWWNPGCGVYLKYKSQPWKNRQGPERDQAHTALWLLGFCSILTDLSLWTGHLIIWNASPHPLLNLIVLSVEAGNLLCWSSRHRLLFFFNYYFLCVCNSYLPSLPPVGWVSRDEGSSWAHPDKQQRWATTSQGYRLLAARLMLSPGWCIHVALEASWSKETIAFRSVLCGTELQQWLVLGLNSLKWRQSDLEIVMQRQWLQPARRSPW